MDERMDNRRPEKLTWRRTSVFKVVLFLIYHNFQFKVEILLTKTVIPHAIACNTLLSFVRMDNN